MPKPSHREKLLSAGLQVVVEQWYRCASVRDIVQAAGVPQVSFTNHFRSKVHQEQHDR
jgi:TetR/AcrR family transcriptional repressor of nem operon